MLERFPVTFGLCATLLAVFAVQFGLGGTMDPEILVRLGSLRADRVLEHGEFYRLFSCTVLHMGPLHILLNGVALFQLCLIAEWIYGSTRTLAFYLVSGLIASVTSLFFTAPYVAGSVGASGAIMGLAGVLFGLQLYGAPGTRGRLNEMIGYRLAIGIVLTFGIGLAITALALPIVDNAAHAGGFLGGLLLAGVYRDPEAALEGGDRLACGGLALVALLSMGWAAADGAEALESYPLDVAQALEARVEAQPEGWVRGLYIQQMATAYRDADAPKTGQAALQRALEDTTSTDTLFALVAGLYETGTDDENALALERWLELEPDAAPALNAMAWHHVTRDDVDERDPLAALPLSERSLVLIADTPEEATYRASFLNTKAEILLQLDRVEEAYSVQSEAVALARAQEEPFLDRMLRFAGVLGPPVLEELETRLATIEARR